MTQSHGHQRAELFNALLKKAKDHEPGLTLGAMKWRFGFEDDAQLRHALDSLVESGHITFDIDGRFPAIRIWRNSYRAVRTLLRPYYLRPGNASEDHVEPPVPEPVDTAAVETRGEAAPEPIVLTVPKVLDEPAQKAAGREMKKRLSAPARSADEPLQVEPVKVVTASTDAADTQTLKRPPVVAVHLTKDQQDWLEAQLEARPDPVALPGLCRELLAAEIERRRNPAPGKMKIPAALVRGAMDAGVPVYDFVAQMALVGLHAREMNLRGV